MEPLFSESFNLLDSGRFAQLEEHLTKELQRFYDNSHGRHVPLVELASCGASRYALLEKWAKEYPQSGYAHCIIAAYWSNWASKWRGTNPSIPEAGGLAAIAAVDLATRWGIHGLDKASDKVFAYYVLYELDRFLGLPEWTNGYNQTDTFGPDANTMKLLSAAGYTQIPPIPALPWPKDIYPAEWLKKQAWNVREDAYLLARSEMHFTRPRWGGSIEEMQALLHSQRFKALPETQLAEMQIWIDTDDVDGFVPDNAGISLSSQIADQFDAALEKTSNTYAKAQGLLLKAQFLYHQEYEHDAAEAVKQAMQICPEIDWELAEYAHIIAMNKISDPLTHKAALAGFRAGDQQAMAALYAYEAYCMTDVPAARLEQIAHHAAQCSGGFDNGWAEFCDDFNSIKQDWALNVLKAGAKAGVPDCYGTLARKYFNMETPEAEKRAEHFARMGVSRNEPMAHFVVGQIEMEQARTNEARQEIIHRMAALGQSDEDALEMAIKWAAQYNSDITYQINLLKRAEDEGFDWVYAHLAYHYCYGIGMERDRELARDYMEEALEQDRADRLAKRIRWSLQVPPLDWFGIPNKAQYME